MIAARKPVDAVAIGIMVLLCSVLGLHQVAIKAAAPDMAPILQVALRSGISVLLVYIVIQWRSGGFSLRDGTLLPGVVVGTAFAAEFLFIAEGLRYTSASHMSVFLYTAPIFTALSLHWLIPTERLAPHQWVGTAFAFGGIALAFLGGSLRSGVDSRMLLGDTLALLGGIAWASTTVMIRCTRLSDAPPTKTLLYQLVAAFVLLLIYAIGSGQSSRFSMTGIAWASVLFQGVVITFGTYLWWFSLLRKYHASQLSAFLFMTPLFGVSFGVLLLDEPIDVFFAIGAVLVLVGITLVSRRQLFNKTAAA